MPKFAVYYVPQQEDPFYRLGSSILGYDVRDRKKVELVDEAQREFEHFDVSWTRLSQPYGLHLTIGPAVDFHLSELYRIERELEDLIECLNPAVPLQLRKNEEHFVTFFGEDKQSAVLRYEANDVFKMFHALIIARINPMGLGTRELRSALKNLEMYAGHKYATKRLLKFYYSGVLDEWLPHFTILAPYTGGHHKEITRSLDNLFGDFKEMTVGSICLLLQVNDEEHFQIYREYNLLTNIR